MRTSKEMLSLRRNLHSTTLERMQGNRNNLHEMRKKGTLRQMLPNKSSWKFCKKQKSRKTTTKNPTNWRMERQWKWRINSRRRESGTNHRRWRKWTLHDERKNQRQWIPDNGRFRITSNHLRDRWIEENNERKTLFLRLNFVIIIVLYYVCVQENTTSNFQLRLMKTAGKKSTDVASSDQSLQIPARWGNRWRDLKV